MGEEHLFGLAMLHMHSHEMGPLNKSEVAPRFVLLGSWHIILLRYCMAQRYLCPRQCSSAQQLTAHVHASSVLCVSIVFCTIVHVGV